jgi:hypothetical protein
VLLVHLLLGNPAELPGTDDEAALLQDAVWAHAARWHGLEHIRVQSTRQGLGIALFIRANTGPAAQKAADDLITNVLGAMPGFSYSVISSPTADW